MSFDAPLSSPSSTRARPREPRATMRSMSSRSPRAMQRVADRGERLPVLEVRVEAGGPHERRARLRVVRDSDAPARGTCPAPAPAAGAPRARARGRSCSPTREARRGSAARSVRYASAASCQRCSIRARSPRVASSGSVVTSPGVTIRVCASMWVGGATTDLGEGVAEHATTPQERSRPTGTRRARRLIARTE